MLPNYKNFREAMKNLQTTELFVNIQKTLKTI